MIYSQGAGATQALSTSVTSAKANLNAGNRAAPYLLIVNASTSVAFVCEAATVTRFVRMLFAIT